MTEHFEVQTSVKLDDGDKAAIENKEALFFYHSWIRTDFQLVELAHDMLVGLADYGLVANYEQTNEYKTIETLIKQIDRLNSDNGKIRLNCRFTGKFEWVNIEYMPEIYNDLIWEVSEYITNAYGIDGYFCGFRDGDWGLWPNWEGY